jgi:hypothetical protein
MSVDTKSARATGRGRNSVRIVSKDLFADGVYILDVDHSTYPVINSGESTNDEAKTSSSAADGFCERLRRRVSLERSKGAQSVLNCPQHSSTFWLNRSPRGTPKLTCRSFSLACLQCPSVAVPFVLSLPSSARRHTGSCASFYSGPHTGRLSQMVGRRVR